MQSAQSVFKTSRAMLQFAVLFSLMLAAPGIMGAHASALASPCNFNAVCEPERAETRDNCVFDCMVAPLDKDVKIFSATWGGCLKIYYFKSDGSRQVITDTTAMEKFVVANIDLANASRINRQTPIDNLTDAIPAFIGISGGYLPDNFCPDSKKPRCTFYAEAEAHEEWFAHQEGMPPEKENRIVRAYHEGLYLPNPTNKWRDALVQAVRREFERDPGFDGILFDATRGYLNTYLFVIMQHEKQTVLTRINNGNKSRYIKTSFPIVQSKQNPVVILNCDDPSITYHPVSTLPKQRTIYFDTNVPDGTVVEVQYYRRATIPAGILDSWRENMLHMLQQTRGSTSGKLILYHGYSPIENQDYDEDFLRYTDGGMLEDMFHGRHKKADSYPPEKKWKFNLDTLQKMSRKKKIFMSVNGCRFGPDTPNEKVRKTALFCFASFLLGKGDYSYFSFSFNDTYTSLVFFDFYKAAIGKPVESYHRRGATNTATVYEREFENCLVLVNPGKTEARIALDDTFRSLSGEPLTSLRLEAHSGTLLFKPTKTGRASTE